MGHGGQLYLGCFRQRGIVESDDRNLIRYPKALSPQQVQHGQGQLIIVADDSGGKGRSSVKEGLQAPNHRTALFLGRIRQNHFRKKGDLVLAKGANESLHPVDPLQVIRFEQPDDTFMAEPDQMVRGHKAAEIIIHD
ncbi:hypothetical protein D1872_261300 [compost metagenome]